MQPPLLQRSVKQLQGNYDLQEIVRQLNLPPATQEVLMKLPEEQLVEMFSEALHQAKLNRDKAEAEAVLTRYQDEDGIVLFCREVLHAEPTPYQEDILRHFVSERRVAVRGPHGLGKSALASWCVLWILTVFDTDSKVITTASVHRQLKHFLWPEIKLWASRADWTKLGIELRYGRELLEMSIRLPGNREAFAASSDDPTAIEGAHATIVACVFDESKAVADGVFDAIEGAFSGAGEETGNRAYAIAISTPGDTQGRFYDIHMRKSGFEDWWVRHVTLEEAVAAKRIGREWAEQRKRQWGVDSPIYLNRVLGEFAETGSDNVIPLRWVEAAIERGKDRGLKGDPEQGGIGIGCDIAWTGDDFSCVALMVGKTLEQLLFFNELNPLQVAGRIKMAALYNTQLSIAVDVIGIGAGTYASLLDDGYEKVIPVNVGEATELNDASGEVQFVNLRSAIWWMGREALDPSKGSEICLPDDDALLGDLTAPKWSVTAKGKIAVESKPDLRKRRNGRSTDAADAFLLALYAQRYVPKSKMTVAKAVGLYRTNPGDNMQAVARILGGF